MWVLAVLTFVLPWVVTIGTPNPFLEGKELLLLAGGWGLILWTLFCRPVLPSQGIRNPFLGWLTLFVVGTGLVHFQYAYLWRTVSQPQVIYNVYTWLPTVSFLMAFLLLRTLALHWFRFPSNLLRLTQWSCLSGTIVAVYAIGQRFRLDQWFYADPHGGNMWDGVYAGFGNPSYLAMYLAALCPLCLVFKPKRYLLYLGIFLLALGLTRVRYAYAFAGIGLLGYTVSRWWKTWTNSQKSLVGLGLLFGGVCLGFCVCRWAHGDERWTIWQHSWQLLLSSPNHRVDSWTGHGLGAYELLTRKTGFGWAHNEWLQALIELGVMGTGLLAGAVGWVTVRAWQQATRNLLDAGWFGVWLVLLMASVIHFPGHIAPLVWLGVCAWAVFERDQGEVANGT